MPSATLLRNHRASVGSLTALADADLTELMSLVGQPDQARDVLMDVLPSIVDTYGSASATIGADFYDELREESGARGMFRAVPADVPLAEQVDALARWSVDPMYQAVPDRDTTLKRVTGGTQRLIANMDRQTIERSAGLDPAKPRFARVVSSSACEFCRMLAGRGAVYLSEAKAGGLGKYHDHCHCQVVPGWGDSAIGQMIPDEPDLQPEAEFVNRLDEALRSGTMTPEDLRKLAATANPLGQVNAEEALRLHAARGTARGQVRQVRPSATDAALTAEQYESLLPSGSWSPAQRDAIVARLRETPGGKALHEVLDSFQDGGSVSRLRTSISKRLAGEAVPAATARKVDALMDAIRNAPDDWAPDTLYRGMTVRGSFDNVMAKYQPGQSIDLSLSSFSSDRSVAKRFQSMTGGGGRETRVMVELVGDGKKAVPIQNIPRDARLRREKEWVSAGRYEVVSVRKSPDGAVLVRMKQTGAL